MSSMVSAAELIELATEARDRAYAPYSGYQVGAALETESGETTSGCNVENLSYGATICAERSAVVRMIAEGKGQSIRQIAVVTKDGGTPCGVCLQVLSEFCRDPHDLVVIAADSQGTYNTFTLADLYPHGFRSKNVRRTEDA